VVQYLQVKSFEYLEPSVRESFIHLDLFVTLLFASFFLGEDVGLREIIGASLIIAGSMLMTIPLGGFKKTLSNRGLGILLLLFAIAPLVGILNKMGLTHVAIATIMLVGYGVPLMSVLLKSHKQLRKVPSFIARERGFFSLSIGCSLAAYGLIMWSLTRIPLSHASMIVRLSSVVGFLAAIVVYREERAHLGLKSASLALVLTGVFITLSVGF
jgi:drug/metabolite transporter (DMT)-like permease